MRFKPVIGLEIHVQLNTKTKAFCSCPADVFELEPNNAICPVCTGQPGALPVPSKQMYEFGILLAAALNCKIHEFTRFDRKNYFYPDLPKGYQITQYFYPLATNGYLKLNGKKIRINRIHLEEDAGKLLHSSETITQAESTLVDMNRCGVPLAEIVTEPDIESPEEARKFLEKLRQILRYLGVSTGDMEKGALRCDANISVIDLENNVQSNKVEVKNMNSFKFVEKALEYEFNRIKKHLKKGENVVKETRGWDLASKKTISMRSKEEANDYRYFPEPDIPPVVIPKEEINKIIEKIPELPDEKINRFKIQYGLTDYEAGILTTSINLANYFEECVKETKNPKETSNWFLTELLKYISPEEVFENLKIKPKHFKELFDLISSGKITRNIAKEIFKEIFETGKNPEEIVKEKGIEVIGDESLIEDMLKKIMAENEDKVNAYKNGKKGLLGFFVGQIMKQTKGKADAKKANEIAKRLLGD
ncbi:glutamyl-tRNA amidotransferase [Thermosipho melanesiensis]|uniref:Aspartyl/glutamyl-tRNA(Asn/Gln) amidotransferase subunit B n=2 Tax=Thermosipho melanesiensis TaxID=46541 RepID=GATB_THEM4|nr:Asp-tRNA(Asn)/Glu-tRNA(Gln) amidotransferase subunit GatB [Thermosipho melanesiensis]A6LLK6.1 RecName: Full=Aspartyl/glutamyl-tRNA(Asn/Gln) amidotransferase subunit B; Short=Asp/Glu-ADT subunit B [Thermosipho melanesiensis BI429]ABR30807.1 glutamyl-tRNA(Gln) amidotransferase, B subunit [Thermosipho melanesiensis BI429]APT73927.1 glutamyl-tRNA amidotransferase [Thermosipho melanesiensis]OOC35864.1 glutamyl-tRNA amidotransferase [Thermosipho melanesiensis]OOC38366.1 glutamyl-tRNA amidotransfe